MERRRSPMAETRRQGVMVSWINCASAISFTKLSVAAV